MTLPEITDRETWLKERKALLAREKELTRLRDEVNADRRRLPMVRVEKEYEFTGPDTSLCFISRAPIEKLERVKAEKGWTCAWYSSYGRAFESVGGAYYWLDLTALGRQEDWEEPKGRSDDVRAARQPNFSS